MTESSDDLCSRIRLQAHRAIQSYAQGLLSVDFLSHQIRQEWEVQRIGDDQPSMDVLKRIAQRICSQTLYNAVYSPDENTRKCAFENIRRYLGQVLLHSRYARQLHHVLDALDDVVHQTLEIIHIHLQQKNGAGPRNPATFLGWMKTILIHKAQEFVEKSERDAHQSLDEHIELLDERFVHPTNGDPLVTVVHDEARQKLLDILLSMRNKNHQRVLRYDIAGLSDQEIADCLHVSLSTVYTWRSRALDTLRKNPEIMEVLRYLLE